MASAPLLRILEEEVMDTPEEAADYDAMDHATVNRAFCTDLLIALRDHAMAKPRVLDVGTGTARIPIELCRLDAQVSVVGCDLAAHMLARGQHNVSEAGLGHRIELVACDAKALPFETGSFDCVVSNTVLHHIPEPEHMLRELWRITAKGGFVFLRDLRRPQSTQELEALVALHAPLPNTPQQARQRKLLTDSLHAAFTIEEVRALAEACAMTNVHITQSSDRHWTLVATRN